MWSLHGRHINQERLAIGEEPIRFGVGIHTGEIMLGTIGEEKRMDGTVISDAVNLATRLEGLSKIYGVVTIISRHTLDRLKRPDRFRFRLLDVVQVKGKQISVEIYEALAPGLCTDDDYKIALLDEFSAAMQLYRDRDFVASQLAFSALLDSNPQDSVARLYVGRCEALAQSGVPENWSGATVFEQK